jgi:hypothetical protein
MLRRYSRKLSAILIVLCLSILGIGSCSRQLSPLEIVKSYEVACNSSDIESLLSLFEDDATVEFIGMGPVVRGLLWIRGKAEYDSTLHTRLELTVKRKELGTVYCSAKETNDWAKTVGISMLVYSQFDLEIKSGKIFSISALLSDSSIVRINEVMTEVVPWAQTNRPRLFTEAFSEGEFSFNTASARATLSLLADWRKSMAE